MGLVRWTLRALDDLSSSTTQLVVVESAGWAGRSISCLSHLPGPAVATPSAPLPLKLGPRRLVRHMASRGFGLLAVHRGAAYELFQRGQVLGYTLNDHGGRRARVRLSPSAGRCVTVQGRSPGPDPGPQGTPPPSSRPRRRPRPRSIRWRFSAAPCSHVDMGFVPAVLVDRLPLRLWVTGKINMGDRLHFRIGSDRRRHRAHDRVERAPGRPRAATHVRAVKPSPSPSREAAADRHRRG